MTFENLCQARQKLRPGAASAGGDQGLYGRPHAPHAARKCGRAGDKKDPAARPRVGHDLQGGTNSLSRKFI